MLTKSQLQTCVHFIRQAAASLEWCRMMFFGAGDSATAARLHEIVTRLTDEAKAIDALIPSAPDSPGTIPSSTM
jgi:hypothetical protein